jgi:hypothetical protein
MFTIPLSLRRVIHVIEDYQTSCRINDDGGAITQDGALSTPTLSELHTYLRSNSFFDPKMLN